MTPRKPTHQCSFNIDNDYKIKIENNRKEHKPLYWWSYCEEGTH